MNSHGISSPDTMASKGRVGDSPLSSKSGINDHFGGVEKNGTFITERVEEYNPEPWQDNRSTFRKLKDWWLFEVLGCLLSIGASCAIIFLLLYYDGQPLPSWPHKVTLNSLLALLTTVAKAGLMIPIGAAIGQLKWIWFAQKERPLADFQTFDEASRGPIGSLKLIGRLKGVHLACIGAIVSILGFGTSFITQQMIAYPSRPVSNRLDTSVSARSDLYYSYVQLGQTTGNSVDFSVKEAAQSGLFHPYDDLIPFLAPLCVSGNCTWEPYRTLQVCSKTANITDRLTYTPLEYESGDVNKTSPRLVNVTLPNGAYLTSSPFRPMNITYLYQASDDISVANHSIAFLDLPNIMNTAIANQFLIYKYDKQERYGDPFLPHYAIEIMFYWCVGEYSTEVKNGIPSSKPVQISTDVKTLNGTIPVSPDIFPNPMIKPRFPQISALVLSGGKDKQENYTVDSPSRVALSDYLMAMLKGETYTSSFSPTSDGAALITSALYDPITIGNVSKTMALQQGIDSQLKTVDTVITNIATSLTNNIRSRVNRGVPAVGTAYVRQSYVEVRWPWLSYLLVLLLLSFILLTGTIYKTKVSKVKIIKSSALAVMYGSTDQVKGNLRHVDERERMVQTAERSNARLVNSGSGWRLTTTPR